MILFPFEATFDKILENPESYVDAVFSCLESEFLIMPKGEGGVPFFSGGLAKPVLSATVMYQNPGFPDGFPIFSQLHSSRLRWISGHRSPRILGMIIEKLHQ